MKSQGTTPRYLELLRHTKRLSKALKDASEHLDYCGYGDRWERECANESKLRERIEDALVQWNASYLSKFAANTATPKPKPISETVTPNLHA